MFRSQRDPISLCLFLNFVHVKKIDIIGHIPEEGMSLIWNGKILRDFGLGTKRVNIEFYAN